MDARSVREATAIGKLDRSKFVPKQKRDAQMAEVGLNQPRLVYVESGDFAWFAHLSAGLTSQANRSAGTFRSKSMAFCYFTYTAITHSRIMIKSSQIYDRRSLIQCTG